MSLLLMIINIPPRSLNFLITLYLSILIGTIEKFKNIYKELTNFIFIIFLVGM